MKKIAVYGGSFNPIHNGHIRVANYLVSKHIVDEVQLMVAPNNPLKKGVEYADAYHRYIMCSKACTNNCVKEIYPSNYQLVNFIGKEAYSSDLFKRLIYENFNFENEYYFVIGVDTFNNFRKFKDYVWLLGSGLVKFIIIPRPGYHIDDSIIEEFPNLWYFYASDFPMSDVSSTEIRRRFSDDSFDPYDYMDEDVVNYIINKNLYQKMSSSITEKWGFRVDEATKKIIADTKEWFDKNFPNGNAVLGISGGKDSTITAKILCEAIGPDRVIGVTMPNGVQKDINDSNRVCDILGIRKLEINIKLPYDGILAALSDYTEVTRQTQENLAPRLRMTTLFAVAQSYNGVVINTGNYSEYMLGWFTFGSDTCGSYAPLLDYTCSEVVEIGLHLGLPEDLIRKIPSDGLCGSSDEEKFGFTYAECDEYLRTRRVADNRDVEDKIVKRIDNSYFKRISLPYSPAVLHRQRIKPSNESEE